MNLYKEIIAILEPYDDMSISKTSDNLSLAKDALLRVLSLLKHSPLPTLYDDLMLYWIPLESIYFALAEGDYLKTCHEITTAVQGYGEEEIYNGIIFLLQKVADGEFPDTYIGKA